MSGDDISPEVEDLINAFRFVDRSTFARTLAETSVQFELGMGGGVARFGLREGAPVALFDIPGAELLPILAPSVD